MKKLVCESLEEYNLLLSEAEGDSKSKLGPLTGTVHAVKTAPGRVLRKARAKMVMTKYKQKLIKKINNIIPKYKQNLEQIVAKINNRLNQIQSSGVPEPEKKAQMETVHEELQQTMRQTLENIRKAMDEQLRVYAESLQNRLEREGTITGVKFYPEEKTNLLSHWRMIETEINALIQKNLIDLLDDVNIVGFQETKAKLEAEIRKIRGNTYVTDVEIPADATILTGDEQKLYEFITKNRRGMAKD